MNLTGPRASSDVRPPIESAQILDATLPRGLGRAATACLALLFFASVLPTAACTKHGRHAEAPPGDGRSIVPACATTADPEGCFAERPIAPPVVVGAERVRLLTRSGLDPSEDPSEGDFVLVDVTFAGHERIAEDSCPEDSVPERMSLLGDGRTAVLCRSERDRMVYIGVLKLDRAEIDWRWEIEHPDDVEYFAEFGGKPILLFRPIGFKRLATPPWAIRLATNPRYKPFCVETEEKDCPTSLVAFVATRSTLHTIMRSRFDYKDFILSRRGKLVTSNATQTAEMTAGTLQDPCISQGQDGSVTVSVPMPALSGPDPIQRIATMRFAKATLPLGPDVYPTETAFCPPREFEDSTNPVLPNELRQWVRATLGERWLVVYTLPEQTGEAWKFDRSAAFGKPYFYPGSLRVYRGAPSEEDLRRPWEVRRKTAGGQGTAGSGQAGKNAVPGKAEAAGSLK